MRSRIVLFVCIALLLLTVGVAVGVGRAGAIAFFPPVTYKTGDAPTMTVVADFNADGRPDLATANYWGESVSVLLGDGNGRFSPRIDRDIHQAPFALAAADFNGDDKLDLVTANIDDTTLSVLLGDGAGSFSAATDFTTEAGPDSVAVGDFNGDGKIDLVSAQGAHDNVSVLLGDGNGGFASRTDFATGAGPVAVAVSDFNGDGKPDLVTRNVSDYFRNVSDYTVSVLLGDGNGGFAARTDFATGGEENGENPRTMTVADFNGDGKVDVAASCNSGIVSVLLGDGDGGFGTRTEIACPLPWSITSADMNADGKTDLVLSCGGSRVVIRVFLGDGQGGFPVKQRFAAGSDPQSPAVGDFNGDGRPDVVTSHMFRVSVLLQGIKPKLGEPAYPASVKQGRSFEVSGSGQLDPSAADTPKVAIKAYRLVGRRWTLVRSVAAIVSGGEGEDLTYRAQISLAKPGTYRFRATSAATTELIAARSILGRKMTVR